MSKFAQALQPKGRKATNTEKLTVYVGLEMPKEIAYNLAIELCGYTPEQANSLKHGNGGSDLARAIIARLEALQA